jgi:ankyrin repeat protein
MLALAACGGDPANVADSEEFRPTTILDAVLVGDRQSVEQFIALGANVNATELDGTSLLMRAIHGRFPEIAKLLINAGASVSAANRYGVSPLYLAARGTDAATIRALLAAGADANTALPEGETVLMTAAKAGDAEVVRMLLTGSSGIALGAFAEPTAASGTASGYGAAAAVTPEPENRADPNAKEGWYGQTALMWAAAEGHTNVVRLLLAAGANVDERSRLVDVPESSYERLDGDFAYPKTPKGGLTALHFAARAGAPDAVRALIEGGADLDTVDAEGTSAVLLATLNDRFDVTRVLLEAGADPNVADIYGRTVLLAATDAHTRDAAPRPASSPPLTSRATPVEVVVLALRNGADPNAALVDKPPGDSAEREQNLVLDKATTPLFRAAMSGDVEIMSLLLDAGANPLAPTEGNTTPLMAAAGVGWHQSINRGREADAIEALELLLARGGDLNAANHAGDTPLHGATLRGSTAIIQFLVDHGARVDTKNDKGQTPLDIAMGVPAEQIPYNEAAASLLRRLTQTG